MGMAITYVCRIPVRQCNIFDPEFESRKWELLLSISGSPLSGTVCDFPIDISVHARRRTKSSATCCYFRQRRLKEIYNLPHVRSRVKVYSIDGKASDARYCRARVYIHVRTANSYRLSLKQEPLSAYRGAPDTYAQSRKVALALSWVYARLGHAQHVAVQMIAIIHLVWKRVGSSLGLCVC